MDYGWIKKSLLIILSSNVVEAKVTIFTHYFGQPEFIEYQYSFFKKNMLDEYELIVFDDASDVLVSEKIEKQCEKYDIRHIRIPRDIFEKHVVGDSSIECAVAIQYIYDNYVLTSDDICLLTDNDIFLISPFSIEKYLGQSPFSYFPQYRGDSYSNDLVDYMLPNFLILNPSKMLEKEGLDFNLGIVEGNRTDSGGFTHFYLQKYRALGKIMSIHYLHDSSSPLKEKFIGECSMLFTMKEWGSHYFIGKEIFLHLRMGSNWSKHSYYNHMINEMTFLFY